MPRQVSIDLPSWGDIFSPTISLSAECQQFRQIKIHQLNFSFFEVPRDFGADHAFCDFPGIYLIVTFRDDFLELGDFFRDEFVTLLPQRLGEFFCLPRRFAEIELD